MRVFSKTVEKINMVYMALAVVMVITIIVSMTLQVFTRYALNAAMVGSEELARYCFVWMTMLGAAICVNKGSDVAISILQDKLKGRPKQVHMVIISLIMVIFAVVLIYQGIKLTSLGIPRKSPTLGISMGLVFASIPVGGVGIMINLIHRIANLMKSKKGE